MRRIATLIVAAALIVLLMPSRGIVSLQPTMEQKWGQETIIAPFDVPIQKTQEQIDNEKKKLSSQIKPVFTIDTLISNSRLRNLSEAKEIDSSLRIIIASALKDIYDTGVVSLSDYDTYKKRAVLLSYGTGNTLNTVYGGSFYTTQRVLNSLSQLYGTHSEVMLPYVVANATYNPVLSGHVQDEALDNISTTRGVVRKGEIIVAKGQIIDHEAMMVISSYNDEMAMRMSQSSSRYMIWLARFVVVFSILLINYLFFTRFAVHYMGEEVRKMVFVLVLYMVIAGMIGLAVRLGVSPYIVPLPIVAIYMLTFFNMRVAILGNLTAVLLCSMFVASPFDYFVINLMSGLMAIFMMRHFYHRGKLMRALGAILITELVLYCCFALMRDDSLVSVDYYNLLWIIAGALLFLGLYQLNYVIERMFSLISDVTLLELCDTNQPLLMQLAQNAPGTFQHSVQVANLAESAAKAIGANPLLARTGAMYHDIGKMNTPFYFVENLSGTFNPHNDCNPQRSVEIIKEHITEGLAIAKKNDLPELVQDFIASHHGRSLIFYFYDKALKENEEVKESDFRYQGPKPVSREVSICMMADAIEAASRSLPSYDKEPLENLVDSIIDSQIKDGQFEDSQLTFEEIGKVKALFKEKLNNIYHGRIAYPARR